MDYIDRLRRLALNDAGVMADDDDVEPIVLDARSLALVRLAALVATGGAQPTYGAETDGAVGAGVSVAEIVDVLVGVIPIVGLPCVVVAAPKVALALGADVLDVGES